MYAHCFYTCICTSYSSYSNYFMYFFCSCSNSEFHSHQNWYVYPVQKIFSRCDIVSTFINIIYKIYYSKYLKCILSPSLFQTRYASGGAALMGIFGVISLLKTTVGSRRFVANDEPLSLNINERPDERTPLLWQV